MYKIYNLWPPGVSPHPPLSRASAAAHLVPCLAHPEAPLPKFGQPTLKVTA